MPEVFIVGFRFVAGMMDDAVPMFQQRIERVELPKGYGIQPQGGGKDVFVHILAVKKAGLSTLNERQVVEYDEIPNKGSTPAKNLKVQWHFITSGGRPRGRRLVAAFPGQKTGAESKAGKKHPTWEGNELSADSPLSLGPRRLDEAIFDHGSVTIG